MILQILLQDLLINLMLEVSIKKLAYSKITRIQLKEFRYQWMIHFLEIIVKC